MIQESVLLVVWVPPPACRVEEVSLEQPPDSVTPVVLALRLGPARLAVDRVVRLERRLREEQVEQLMPECLEEPAILAPSAFAVPPFSQEEASCPA